MGRFLKIAVYIAVLFLGYLWIATVAKSCNKTSTADSEDNTEMVDDIASDEFEDDFFEDEDDSSDEMGGGSDSSNDEFDTEGTIDYTEVDEVIEEVRTPTRKVSTPVSQPTANSSSSRSGKYLLLAGSYLIEDNAQVMVNKLRKIGYSNAEVVVFDMSQYHSVCAGRFTNMSSAKQESSSLKRKGVDNYVHTRQ